jgi:hypothetical protein
MSKDLIVTSSGDPASKARQAWQSTLASPRGETRFSSPAPSDEVRLSILHKAITFSEIAGRVERLELAVSRREYSVPASEISQSIIKEHLAAVSA